MGAFLFIPGPFPVDRNIFDDAFQVNIADGLQIPVSLLQPYFWLQAISECWQGIREYLSHPVGAIDLHEELDYVLRGAGLGRGQMNLQEDEDKQKSPRSLRHGGFFVYPWPFSRRSKYL